MKNNRSKGFAYIEFEDVSVEHGSKEGLLSPESPLTF